MILNIKSFVFPCSNLFCALNREKYKEAENYNSLQQYYMVDDVNNECSFYRFCFCSPFLVMTNIELPVDGRIF